MIFAEIKV